MGHVSRVIEEHLSLRVEEGRLRVFHEQISLIENVHINGWMRNVRVFVNVNNCQGMNFIFPLWEGFSLLLLQYYWHVRWEPGARDCRWYPWHLFHCQSHAQPRPAHFHSLLSNCQLFSPAVCLCLCLHLTSSPSNSFPFLPRVIWISGGIWYRLYLESLSSSSSEISSPG